MLNWTFLVNTSLYEHLFTITLNISFCPVYTISASASCLFRPFYLINRVICPPDLGFFVFIHPSPSIHLTYTLPPVIRIYISH